ncbi:glycosyltransferase [Intrasporangium flavum]|uniref:glycosyltransferase n=1 Tax=Intrasporangium flavum TaxID=1428657 RepID=UPI00096FF85C|nr:glycosyltransferase [Intrasporangium flavum]
MRVMFASIPAHGHVLPLLPLAAAVAAAGHDVELGAGVTFAGHVPVPVVPIVPEGMTLHDAEEEARAEVRDPSDPMGWPTAMFGVVMPRHVTPRLLAHWDRHGRPDLVVHEGSNVGAAVAARTAGVPAVSFHVSLTPPMFFLDALRSVIDFPLDVMLDPRPDSWRGSEELPFERVPVRSTGWSDPRGAGPEWLDAAGGPTAYLTLGTVAFGAVDILRRSVLETAERCDRVLVAAGPEADVEALGALPDHVRVERYVDQPAVLDRVDIAVHHDGTGTVLGCLAAGVPQVITPQGADQFLNASRLAELGLGHAVHNDADTSDVGTAVDALLTDESLRGRVTQVREEIAAMPGPEAVAAALAERYAP